MADWENDIGDIMKDAKLPKESYGYEPGSPLAILSDYFGRKLTKDELFLFNSMAEDAFRKGKGQLVLLEIVARQAPQLLERIGAHSYPQGQSYKTLEHLSFTTGYIYGYLTKQEFEA